jgi:hypothetical protein
VRRGQMTKRRSSLQKTRSSGRARVTGAARAAPR